MELAAVLLTMLAIAQQAKGAAVAQPLLTPRMAVQLAHDDAATLGLIDGAHQFYVYFPETSRLGQAAVAYAINTALSHTSNLYRPVPVAGGKLLRIDKRELVPDPEDRKRLDHLFENVMAFSEPYTHRSDLVRGSKGEVLVKVKVTPYTAKDGKTYRHKFEVIRREEQFAAHVGIDKMLGLYALLGETNLPIVRADWFVCMIQSTQKVGRADGLYYDFRGWDINKTTQDDILRELGAGEDQIKEQKLTLLQQIVAAKANAELFSSTSRAGLFHSSITDRERRIDSFVGTKIRPASGVGIVFLTHDLDRKSVKAEQSPFQNLVLFPDDGREGIGLLPNGMQAYWASNGEGKLVKGVPEGIAHDSSIPHPSPQTLDTMSCPVCHGPHDGYIPFRNDFLDLSRERIPTSDLTKFDQINVFDDDSLVLAGFTLEQSKHILRGLFGRDLDPAILLAQQQHGRAVAELTGGMKVSEVTGEGGRMRNYYVHGVVTTEIALAETGRRFVDPDYGPDEPDANDDVDEASRKAANRAIKRNERMKELVHEHCPPLPKVNGRSPEHQMINVLRGGRFSIPRAQWENVYPDFMGRAEAAMSLAN